jgi:hypothetical protein
MPKTLPCQSESNSRFMIRNFVALLTFNVIVSAPFVGPAANLSKGIRSHRVFRASEQLVVSVLFICEPS